MDDSIDDFAKSQVQELLKSLSRDVSENLIKMLNIVKKSELIKYCKDLMITGDDFFSLIRNANTIDYRYQRKFHDFVPNQLQIKDNDFNVFSEKTSDEKTAMPVNKLINKINQISIQRKYRSSHLFFNENKWHLFYFDQRDIENNHWKEGPHLHFLNYLWPNLNPFIVWETLDKSNMNISGSLHIKFNPIVD